MSYQQQMEQLAERYEHFTDVPLTQLPVADWWSAARDPMDAVTNGRDADYMSVVHVLIPAALAEYEKMRRGERCAIGQAAVALVSAIWTAAAHYSEDDLCDAFARDTFAERDSAADSRRDAA